MVVNTSEEPLFWYAYKPTAKRENPENGGFSIALYRSNRLNFRQYDIYGRYTESDLLLPPEVLGRYAMIQESQDWWLRDVPLEIRYNQQGGLRLRTDDGDPTYVCLFGFEGYPLFECHEINQLVKRPFNSLRGMYARRLRMMLESVAEMLYVCGIRLTVDTFGWGWNVMQPTGSMEAVEAKPITDRMPHADYYNYGQYRQNA